MSECFAFQSAVSWDVARSEGVGGGQQGDECQSQEGRDEVCSRPHLLPDVNFAVHESRVQDMAVAVIGDT